MSDEQNILQWLGSVLGLGGAMLWIRFLFSTQNMRIETLERNLTDHKDSVAKRHATHDDVDKAIEQSRINHQEVMRALEKLEKRLENNNNNFRQGCE